MFLFQGLLKLLLVFPVLGSDLFQHTLSSHVKVNDRTCTIIPSGGDDAPSIVAAFRICNKDHTILFENKTYHVNQVMSTHGLDNVTIDVRGTVLVCIDTENRLYSYKLTYCFSGVPIQTTGLQTVFRWVIKISPSLGTSAGTI
jgi:hypothetical protein